MRHSAYPVVLTAIVVALAARAGAQPSNDECATASVVTVLPFVQLVPSGDATTAASDPVHGCTGSADRHSLWWSFTAPADGTVAARASILGTVPVLTAYVGGCGTPSEIACEETTPPYFPSPGALLDVTAGTTYLFEVTDGEGGGAVVFELDFGLPAANDECIAAASLAVPGEATVASVHATSGASDPSLSCLGGSPGYSTVWYSFTSPGDGQMLVTADTVADYYTPITYVAAFAGSCEVLSELSCGSVSGFPYGPVAIPVSSGGSYLLEVATNGGGGVARLSAEFAPRAANDACFARTVVAGLPFDDLVDTSMAGIGIEDPVHSCTAQTDYASVWYEVTAPVDGILVADARSNSLGGPYNPLVAIYSGGCGIGETACQVTHAEIPVTMGSTYVVQVTDANGPTGGTLDFHMELLPAAQNDDCVDATVVGATPYTDGVTTTDTTTELADPVHSCTGGQDGHSVWYRYTAPADGLLRVGASTSYQSRLAAYTGACGSLTEVACGFSALDLPVTGGTTYLIQATAWDGTPGGRLLLSLDQGTPPPNDACATPTAVATTPFADVLSEREKFATVDPADPVPSCQSAFGYASVWYAYTAPADGLVRAQVYGYDRLAAYMGVCGALTEVACADFSSNGEIVFPVAAGTTYSIKVDGFANNGNAIDVLTIDYSPPIGDACTAPQIVTTTPFEDVVDLRFATTDPSEQYLCAIQVARAVWYEFVAPSDGDLEVTAGNYGAVVGINEPCSQGSFACNQYQTGTHVMSGEVYAIEVAGPPAVVPVRIDFAADAPNDACEDATAVTTVPFAAAVGTTAATTSTSDPMLACVSSPDTHTIWYAFTAPESGAFSVEAIGPQASYYRAVAVYSGPCQSPSPVACGRFGYTTFDAAAGITYLVEVVGGYGAGGIVDVVFERRCGNGTLDPGVEQCDDGNSLDGDGCDSNCTPTACGNGIVTAGEQCDDVNVVDGDCCSAACEFEPAGNPCNNDGDLCTNGSCSGSGACVEVGAPVATCRRPFVPGKAALAFTLGAKAKLSWKWVKGERTDVGDFGDPTIDTTYRLCVYDSSVASQPLLSLPSPPMGYCGSRPCWKAAGQSGFQGKSAGTAELDQMKLKAGLDGKAVVGAKDKVPFFVPPALPLTLPLTVELRASNGNCWSARYIAPVLNGPEKFKAKAE